MLEQGDKRLKVTIGALAIFISSSLISTIGASFLAENYFFDKFFYRKSEKFGYFQSQGPRNTNRGKHLQELEEPALGNVLGASNPQKNKESYDIAVFGDSFTWGMGVKDEETIPEQLSAVLNKYRKTNIVSFAYPGDSILEYLQKFDKVRASYFPDLYIFVLYSNDPFPLPTARDYRELIKHCQQKFPPIPLIFGTPLEVDFLPENEEEHQVNFCLFEEALKLLPDDNAIYLLIEDIYPHEYWLPYIDILVKQKKNIIYPADYTQDKYKKYWDNPEKYIRVSQMETHYTKVAYKSMAEAIYEFLLKNPEFGFALD